MIAWRAFQCRDRQKPLGSFLRLLHDDFFTQDRRRAQQLLYSMARTAWSCEIWTCPSEFFMVSVNEMHDSLKSPCIYFVAEIPAGSWETGFHTKPETGFQSKPETGFQTKTETGFQTKSDGRGGFLGNIVDTYVLFFFCKYLASIYRKHLSILIQRFIFRPWLWLVPWKADMVSELLLSNENILDFTLGYWETTF